MKKKLLALVLLLLPINVLPQVKTLMGQMVTELYKLKPYIASEEKYVDPKNQAVISNALKKMVEISQRIKHEDSIRRTGLLVSSNVLDQHLKEAEAVYNEGASSYSLAMFRGGLSACMNCHTQGPSPKVDFSAENKGTVLANAFDEGEFLFITRNFSDAMKSYDLALGGYPKNKLPDLDLEKIVLRQLFYYVRVEQNFQSLIEVLKRDLGNKNLPAALQKNIHSLQFAAENLKKQKFPKFKGTEEEDLRKYVEGQLKEEINGKFSFENPEKELHFLKVSGVLYDYLKKNPGTRLKPDILYWLAICESHFSRDAFYTFPELYLKQCVTEFPKNPVANKCLTQYQDLVTAHFSGTKGTHIPEATASQIKALQELVKQVGD